MTDAPAAAPAAAPSPAPSEPDDDRLTYGVLLKDVDGLGPSGHVFASKTKVAVKRMADAGDARLATEDEVEMARPFILTLES